MQADWEAFSAGGSVGALGAGGRQRGAVLASLAGAASVYGEAGGPMDDVAWARLLREAGCETGFLGGGLEPFLSGGGGGGGGGRGAEGAD